MAGIGFNELPPGLFRPVTVPALAAPAPLAYRGAIRIGGWSFMETSGAAPATLELLDGSAQGGETLALIVLAAGAAVRDLAPGLGLLLETGLFLNVIAGSVRGSVWAADQ